MVTFTEQQTAGKTPDQQPYKGLREQVLGQPEQVKMPQLEQPWVGLKDQITGGDTRFNLSAATAFEKEDSDRSARILKVADQAKLPIDFVERNLERLEKDVAKKGFNAKEYRKNNPVVSEWLSQNPHYFAAAKDDLSILEQAENLVKRWGERSASLLGGFAQLSQLAVGQGTPPLIAGIDSMEQLAARTPGDELPEQAAQRMNPSEAQQKQLERLLTQAADRIGNTDFGYEEYTTFEDFKQSPLENFLPFAIEQGIGSIPDMAAAIISLPAYSAARTGEIARNRAEMDLRDVPTTGDFLAALPAAAADGILERLSAKYLVGLDGPVGSVTQLPGRIAGAAAREGATEFVQESIEQTATTLGTETGFDVGQTFEAGLAGLVGGAGFGGAVRSVTAPVQLGIERARGNQRKRFFEALGENAENSKLRERVPEKYREVFDRLTKDGPVETMFIPEEAHREFWQSQGVDPRKAAEDVFGDASYYDNAANTGGMMEVPTALYAERVAADRELNSFYQDNSTFDPTEMTVAEFERAQQEAENLEVTEEVGEAETVTAEQRIYQDLFGQLQQTTSREVADSQARYVATVFSTLGQRSGMDPYELYQSRSLRVRRDVPQELRQPEQITNLDFILNAARDDALPTDKEIYGPRFIDIMRREGIIDEGGELSARDVDANQVGRNRMVRESGRWTLDDAAERAFELGIIEQNDQDLLLELIDRELAGERVVIPDQFNEKLANQRQYAEGLLEYLESIDVDLNDLTNQQIAAIIAGDAQPSDFTDQQDDDGVTLEQVVPAEKMAMYREIENAIYADTDSFFENGEFQSDKYAEAADDAEQAVSEEVYQQWKNGDWQDLARVYLSEQDFQQMVQRNYGRTVYHGTNAEFDALDMSQFDGGAIFAATNRDGAEAYGERVIEFSIYPRNPLIVETSDVTADIDTNPGLISEIKAMGYDSIISASDGDLMVLDESVLSESVTLNQTQEGSYPSRSDVAIAVDNGDIESLQQYVQAVIDNADAVESISTDAGAYNVEGIDVGFVISSGGRFATAVSASGDVYAVREDNEPIEISQGDRRQSIITNTLSRAFDEIRSASPEAQQRADEMMREEQRQREIQRRIIEAPAATGDFVTDLQAYADYAENFEEFQALLSADMLDTSDRNRTRLARAISALDPETITAANVAELEPSLIDPANFGNDQVASEIAVQLSENPERITVYRGMTADGSIEAGDWVSPSRDYAREHEKYTEGKTATKRKTVFADELIWYGADIREWVYVPRNTFRGIDSLEQLYQKLTQREFKQSGVTKAQVDSLKNEVSSIGADVSLLLKASSGQLELMNISVPKESRGRGIARQALEKITTFADVNGLTITLDAEPQETGITKKRLKDLYKSAGFVENKGANKDYAISRDMYREPQQIREQKRGDTPRGTIRFGAETGFSREFTITLNENADLSTFLHEAGHLFLETMFDLAEMENAPQQIKDDVAAILKNMGVESRDQVGATQHEMFAEWHEMYLREGKAPSDELRSLFATFWSWLIRVYKSMKDIGITGTRLNDEVRGIMDRLVATDAEIEAASSETQQLWESFEESGMTKEEWDDYLKEISESRMEAQEEVTRKVMREQERAKKQWYRNEREKVYREIKSEVDQMRVYRALDVLQRGKAPDGSDLPEGMNPTKLSKQGIIGLRGEAYLKRLPRPYVYTREGGVSPQLFAQQMGFEDAETMLNEIEGARKKSDYINSLVDEEMRQRYGDMLLDGEIPAEALAAVHNERRVDVLKREIKSLSRRAGKRAAPVELVRQQAERIISQRRVKDIQPNVYRMAERKASRAAFRAATDGNYEEAFKQKQKEMLNHELWKQSRDAREFEERVANHMRKLGKKSAQQRIGKAGADYLEQINGILDMYEFKRQSNKELQRRQSLRAWMREKEQNGETLGDEFMVPDEVIERSQRVNYRELPLQELRGVFDMVRQIEHFARTKNRLLQEKAKRDKDEARAELISALEANIKNRGKPPLTKNAMNVRDRMSSRARKFDASMLKMEQMIEWLDDGNLDGPWHRLLWDGAVEAQALEQDYTETVTKKIAEAVENIPPEVRKRMLDHTGVVAGRRMVRKDIIGVALNVGNKSNYDKLLKGMGWSEADVEAMLSMLTKEEWDFIQSVWDTLESLWPEIAKLEKDITGLEPAKVEPRKVETKFGTYNGGYYPVMYDPNYSEQGELQLSANIGDMLEKGYTRATTPKGHTKERVEGYARPFNLDIDFLTLHTAGVIKDLTHRKWLIDANWIVNDTKIREVINETLGVEYQGFFKDWVKNVANDRNASNLQTLGVWKSMFERLRLNMMIATMGFKATTIISQIAGIGPSIEVVGGKEGDGVKWIARAYGKLALRPNEILDVWRMVKEKSPEMRYRLQNKDRDIRSALRNVQGKDDWLSQIQNASMAGIGYADLMVTLPTWIGAYDKAQAQGLSEELSIKAGDRAVRLSQGSGGAKDLASVASRNDTLMRLMTMYYTPFSAMHNRLRNIGHEFGGIKDVPKAFGKVFWLAIVPATLGELLVGRGPEEDEEWAEWMLNTNLSYLTLGVPFLRDIASATVSDFGYTFTPIAQVGKKTANVGKDLNELITGDKPKDEAIVELAKATFSATGYWIGVPTSQLEITGGYMYDLAVGNDDTENFVEKIMYRREED